MAITTNQTVQFNIDSIADNQILVYDANVGAFVNETIASLVAEGGAVTGVGRNIGDTGIGIYKANDGAYLDFYKLSAGANTTLSLANNVITIDAVTGTGTVNVQSATSNAVAVYDETGNSLLGASGISFSDGTLYVAGDNNTVGITDGAITATSANVQYLNIGGNFDFPTVDGTVGQVLRTDGTGQVSWSNEQDISGKVDSLLFNAHIATSITETSNHAPALHDFYSLGNATNKYHQVFSTYFRGTADISVNAINLGSQPASNYMLRSDTMDADQIRSEIANIVIPDTGEFISSVNVSDGNITFSTTDINIVSGDSNIVVSADPNTETLTLTTDINVHSFGRVSAEGNVYNYIVADRQNDVLNFAAGPGISVVADSNADSILISSTYREINVISDLLDVNSIGIQGGQTLIWNASNSQFEAGTISVPTDLSEFTDSTGLIPSDLTDLTDTTNLVPSDLSDLTDTTNLVPSDLSQLTDTTNLVPSDISQLTDTANLLGSAGPAVSELIVGTRLGSTSIPLTAGGLLNITSRTGTVAISLS